LAINGGFHAAQRSFLAMNHISSSFEMAMSAVMEPKNKAIKNRSKGIPQLASLFGGRIAGGASLIRLGLMLVRCRSKDDHETILPEAGLSARLHGTDIEKIHRAIFTRRRIEAGTRGFDSTVNGYQARPRAFG
jgi:hypothetical protein